MELLEIISLPKEVVNNILIWLDYQDIINYGISCKSASFILFDKYFWEKKAKKIFYPSADIKHNDIAILFDNNNIYPYIRYKYLIDNYWFLLYEGYVWNRDVAEIESREQMALAVKKEDENLIKFLLILDNSVKKLPFPYNYNYNRFLLSSFGIIKEPRFY